MSINFIDPRDNSVLVKTDQEIADFFQDLASGLKTYYELNNKQVEEVINKIKADNGSILRKTTKKVRWLYISIEYMYLKVLLEIVKIHNIPISLYLADTRFTAYDYIIKDLQNTTFLKKLIISSHDVFDQKIADIFLTTDIYELEIFNIEYDYVGSYFQLLAHNKLIKLTLRRYRDKITDDSLIFNELLKALLSNQPNNLQELILNGLKLSAATNERLYIDQENIEMLAKLIQNNVNLDIISLNDCNLSLNFLSLLLDNLLQLENNSNRPLILNLKNNINIAKVMDKLAENLARQVNISELNLKYTNIDEAGANYIAKGLAANRLLTTLNLEKCPISHGIQSICQAIINNPGSNLSRINIRSMKFSNNNKVFDLEDAKSIAELIKSDKMTKIDLFSSIGKNSQITPEELKEIYLVLLAALAQNNSLSVSDLDFAGLDDSDPDIIAKIREVLINRTKTIELAYLQNEELSVFMQLQIDNEALSSKTLIQILTEFKY